MRTLSRIVDRLARAMHVTSGLLLVVMMLTTMADVVSRGLFAASGGELDVTFVGGVEIVRYGLLFMVLFALPYSVSRSQVIVDLFTERLSERRKAALDGVYVFGFALLGAGMAVRFWEATGRVARTGETTQDLLIPLQYVYAVATFATAMLALRALLVALSRLGYDVSGDRRPT